MRGLIYTKNMFLFNKRTRNIIKYLWGFFAILIVLSMVIAYSGFATLARTPADQESIEIPDDVRAQLELQKKGITNDTGASTPEEQAILDAINEGTIDISGSTTTPNENRASSTAPIQELKLEI
jgi:hypothetical protein